VVFTEAAGTAAIDVALHQDDQVGHAAGRIHQRRSVGAARRDPFDVGLAEAVAADGLDHKAVKVIARERHLHRNRRQRAVEAIDVLVELEHAPVPGNDRLEHAVAVEHGMIQHRDARLAFGNKLAVHIDDSFRHDALHCCLPVNRRHRPVSRR
jgi:hypothetical protein